MLVLYFDCISGLTEDMILAALLHAQKNEISLAKKLSGLGLPPCEIHCRRGGEVFPANRVSLQSPHSGEQTFFQLLDIIEETGLSDDFKERVIHIFTNLAEAQARVLELPLKNVRIEDALTKVIKTIAILLCIQGLAPRKILISPIRFATKFVNQNAPCTIPSPETMELLKGLAICTGSNRTGFVTPLGAAIARTLVTDMAEEPAMILDSLGYGGDDQADNLLRVMVGTVSSLMQDHLALLETNIDDMNPELHPFVLDKLLAEGALDVFYTPIIMKKGRPAVKLTVICRPQDVDALTGVILQETSSLGVRIAYQNRKKLFREIRKVNTPYGPVKIKLARLGPGQPVLNLKPEYEDCRALANRLHIPVKEVYQAALQEGRERWIRC
ncbi:LarC family nickel insertion protein [Desulfotomaculum sp. 1211_IL3151]|uniref:LarC family nickel insertion protein n=1 Tax=Desulfotomaculum sp. 1211_IL3151 TaxID=3084055 RepID=UPI002FDA9A34